MTAQTAHQRFGLGTLVGSGGETSPQSTEVEVIGRGIFTRIRLTFGFSGLSESGPRVFIMDRPWNSVVAGVKINGEAAGPLFGRPEPKPVHAAFMTDLDSAGQGRPGLACHIPEGVALSTLSIEFCMALELLSHQGVLAFRVPSGSREIKFTGNWNLSGLTGATLTPWGSAGSLSMSVDGSTHAWQTVLSVSSEDEMMLSLTLDEKKPASLSLFTPSKGGTGKGCASVAVVAPVRPQLVRDSIRVAIYVEVRNPQEGLTVRELVARAASTLKGDDQVRISLMGPDSIRPLLGWTQCEDIDDDALAPLLEPTAVGTPQDLMIALKQISQGLGDASHVILATPGAHKPAGADLALAVPTFILATGQKPHRAVLESLAEPTGGFVSELHPGGVDSFLERMRTRLSPPLLRDFKLDGWGLEEVYPPGLTQVYTDHPTLVFGLYDGLLPKKVTLTGFSPAGQKLAQRVKVESVEDFDLMPLYVETARRWKGQAGRTGVWTASDFACYAYSHPVGLARLLTPVEVESAAPSGPELMAPPKLGPVHTAVTMDEETFSGLSPVAEADTIYEKPKAPAIASPEPEPEPEAEDDSAPLLQLKKPDSGSPVRIFGSVPDEGEEEEAEPSLMAEPDQDFEVPTGPPQIFNSGVAVEPEGSVATSGKRPDFAKKEEDEGSLLRGVPGGLSGAPESSPAQEAEPPPAPPEDVFSPEPDEPEPLLAAAPEPPITEPEFEALPATAPLSTESLSEPVQTAPAPAPAPTEGDWSLRILTLDPERAREWLNQCSVDALGLALVDLDRPTANKILSQLDGMRREAVDLQRQMGEMLEPQERNEASRELWRALTS